MNDRQSVLLTGATGALGPALAAELLAADPTRELRVLIRHSAASTVAERFNDWLDAVSGVLSQRPGPLHPWRNRVIPIEGDVRTDGLGLNDATANELLRTTGLIIHAAADTQFMNSPEVQWDTNVEGTRRVLEIARNCRNNPRFILVSTICTSGQRTGRISETFLPDPPTFVNHYERTKWEAERLCIAADIPLAIARVSIVMGAHADGTVHRPGALHHILKWFFRGLIPFVPGTDQTRVDLISTETVSRFIARAASACWDRGAIWNVAAGDEAATINELTEVTWNVARPGQIIENIEQPGLPFIVDRNAFEELCRARTSPRDRLFRQAMDSINSFVPGLLYPRVYDTSSAEQLWGGPIPKPDWKQTLLRVIRACEFDKDQRAVAKNGRKRAAECAPIAQ